MSPPAINDKGDPPLTDPVTMGQTTTTNPTECQYMIAGAGIVGLVLALCLQKDLNITATIYEQAPEFSYEIGAAMGMYANGLRVLRHIDPNLMQKVQAAGYPYLFRRYERHDGTTVAVAEEGKLGDDFVQSMGIRRGRLQQILVEAVREANIPIVFGKRVANVQEEADGSRILVTFTDESQCRTVFLFAADGARSQVRSTVLEWEKKKAVNETKKNTDGLLTDDDDNSNVDDPAADSTKPTTSPASTKKFEEVPALYYTGVTCFMGMASMARPERGICFPSSLTSKFHAVFFPTSENEQCFQFHYPVADLDKARDTWGALSKEDAQKECRSMANQLRADGWHERFLEPLENVTHAVRIGFALLQPRLKHWVYGSQRRIVLLGDAAHPPVPYLGQGAQMGLEDAGTLSFLLKSMCLDINGTFQSTNFGAATKLYETMRIPRTRAILDHSKCWGKIQQQRADTEVRNHARETLIKRDLFFHEALPILLPGATYDFEKAVEQVLAKEPVHLAMVKEDAIEQNDSV